MPVPTTMAPDLCWENDGWLAPVTAAMERRVAETPDLGNEDFGLLVSPIRTVFLPSYLRQAGVDCGPLMERRLIMGGTISRLTGRMVDVAFRISWLDDIRILCAVVVLSGCFVRLLLCPDALSGRCSVRNALSGLLCLGFSIQCSVRMVICLGEGWLVVLWSGWRFFLTECLVFLLFAYFSFLEVVLRDIRLYTYWNSPRYHYEELYLETHLDITPRTDMMRYSQPYEVWVDVMI
ncbi:hypothetical protein Dimus_012979 [Dionaea muscipula]